MLAEALARSGYDDAVAHDGPHAPRACCVTFRPEVAVLDIGLPVMDGYELARRHLDESRTPRRASSR